MKLIRVGAAVLNQTPLDWDGNAARIREAISAAREAGVSILCLPELCITGYGCEDAFHAPETQRKALQLLEELKAETAGMIVSFGLPLLVCGSLYNTACLVVNGNILGFAGKQNLAGDGIHYEQRWFKPFPAGAQYAFHANNGRLYEIGDFVFEVGNVRIGFEICEDAWVADRPGADLASRGVDLILNPSASHFAFGKHEIRKRFVIEGSRAFNVGYVYANLLGNEAGRAIYDGDAMIAQAGKLLVTGPRFSYADWHVTHAVVDIDLIRMNRARSVSFRPNLRELDSNWLGDDFDYPEIPPSNPSLTEFAWESSPHVKEEEFTRAESL